MQGQGWTHSAFSLDHQTCLCGQLFCCNLLNLFHFQKPALNHTIMNNLIVIVAAISTVLSVIAGE